MITAGHGSYYSCYTRFKISAHVITITEMVLLSQFPQIYTLFCTVLKLLLILQIITILRKKECFSIDFIALTTQKLTFHAPTIVTSTPCKSTTKMRFSLSKITVCDEKSNWTPYSILFTPVSPALYDVRRFGGHRGG